MDRIWTVIQKEITEALRNRMTMATILISTLVFMLLPLAMAYGMGPNGLLQKVSNKPIDTTTLSPILQVYPQLRSLEPAAQLQGFLLSGIQALFLIIPLMVPMIIAVYSVIGEKQNRSLEAVLATHPEVVERMGQLLADRQAGLEAADATPEAERPTSERSRKLISQIRMWFKLV